MQIPIFMKSHFEFEMAANLIYFICNPIFYDVLLLHAQSEELFALSDFCYKPCGNLRYGIVFHSKFLSEAQFEMKTINFKKKTAQFKIEINQIPYIFKYAFFSHMNRFGSGVTEILKPYLLYMKQLRLDRVRKTWGKIYPLYFNCFQA